MRILVLVACAWLLVALSATPPAGAAVGAPCWTSPVGPGPLAAGSAAEGHGVAAEPTRERRDEAGGGPGPAAAPASRGPRLAPPAGAYAAPRALAGVEGDRPAALAFLRVNGSANAHGARA